ncbi:MAG: HAD family hydrolase [Armatimonadota bacterium]|nr:MAG: HAD family hydrolase [Armatimonadota bacterium]
MKPDVVFLDFGGTIAEQTNTREEAIARSLAMLEEAPALSEIERAMAAAKEKYAGRSSHSLTLPEREEHFIGLYQAVAAALGFGDDSRRIGEHLWETQKDSYALYPEVMLALDSLRAAGARLGIISNWDKLNLADVCRDLAIADRFEVMLPSAEAEADKPDPRIFRRALQLMGAEPEACLHVGDSYGADVKGAQGVGMVGILVHRGGEQQFDCPTVRGLDEIVPLLARL